jgi:predicted Zn finger-like uncharacterized protein
MDGGAPAGCRRRPTIRDEVCAHMARLIACPECGSRFDVTSMQIGTRFRCGTCSRTLVVPQPRMKAPKPAAEAPRSRTAPRKRQVARAPAKKAAPRRASGNKVQFPPKSAPAARRAPVQRQAPARQQPAAPAARQPAARQPAPAARQPAPEQPPRPPTPHPDENTTGVLDMPVRDRLLGQVVSGNFRIDLKLGDGGYGVVYKATDLTLQRQVALKIMHPRLTTKPELVAKFRREAKTAAALAHRNIVSIHQVGHDKQLLGGIHYLAMEFVDGRTLTELLRERGPLDVQEAIDFILQAATGLGAAHAKQIIHRDIKPGNLMITDRGVVKVADFGLAKVTTDNNTSAIIGTPHFMPPEQFEGKARDGRSDIYSLGVTFYLMLSNKRPFTGNNPAAVLRNIVTKSPIPIDEHVSGLPADLWPIIEKMLARDLADRYADMGEIIRDLRRLYAQEAGGGRIFCPDCGTPNQLGVTKCEDCSTSLMEPCPKCGTEDFIGMKFCGNCGANIVQEREFAEILAEGRNLRTSGRPDRALEKFRHLVDLRPDDDEVQTALEFIEKEAQALDKHRSAVSKALSAEDLNRAAELIEQATERFAGDPFLREAKETVADRLRKGQIGSCLATARKCLAAKEFARALAAAEEAAAAGAEAAAADPLSQEARAALDKLADHAARARGLEAEGSVTAAIEEWEQAALLSPQWPPAVEALDAHRERLARAATSRERAREALDAGQFAEARAIAEGVFDEIPGDVGATQLITEITQAESEAHRRLVAALRHVATGNSRSAFDEIEDLRDTCPSYPDLDTIRDHIETLLHAAEYFRRAAGDSEKAGRFDQASAFAEVASRLDITDARARESVARSEREAEARRSSLGHARERLTAGDFEGAAKAIKPLAEAHPNDREIMEIWTRSREGALNARQEKKRVLVQRLNAAMKDGRQALRDGSLAAARIAAETAETIAPSHPEVKALRREVDGMADRERKVEETAFFELKDLRRMAREKR